MSEQMPVATTTTSSLQHKWSALARIQRALEQAGAVPAYCTMLLGVLNIPAHRPELLLIVGHKEPHHDWIDRSVIFTARVSDSAEAGWYIVLDGYTKQGERLHYSWEFGTVLPATVQHTAVAMVRSCS